MFCLLVSKLKGAEVISFDCSPLGSAKKVQCRVSKMYINPDNCKNHKLFLFN